MIVWPKGFYRYRNLFIYPALKEFPYCLKNKNTVNGQKRVSQ
jgi:hypothetical protein